jgi:hypothetical protein
VLVEEPGEVGPAVERAVRTLPQRCTRPLARLLEIRRARARPVRVAALRRPARDEPEMRGQAPAPVRLEHVVLQDEVPRVRPVVRDLACVVVAQHVRVAEAEACRAAPVAAAVADEPAAVDADEAVHAPAVHVPLARERAVLATGVVAAVPIEERLHALPDPVRRADRRPAVLHGDPVGVRVRAEEGVEGAVLLHDHDHVPDLVDAGPRRVGCGRRGATRRRGESEQQRGDSQRVS